MKIGMVSVRMFGQLSLSIFGLFLLSVTVWPVAAEAANSYSISPPIIDLELEKRDIVNKEVTITNHSNRQIRIYPSVHEVSIDNNGSIENFVPASMQENRASAVTSWISVPRSRIVIKAGESTTVPVSIKLHPEVEAGEYHAIIGFGDGSNRPQAEAKVKNGTAPGTVIRVGVDKVQNQFIRLERFTVERFVTSEDGEIRYQLYNPGSDPVVPAGEIIIYHNNGNEAGAIPVNPEQLIVEPGKSLGITAKAPAELSLGKYKAFLSVEYGEHLTASVHDTAFFYVLPFKQLVALMMGIMVVAIVVALYIHRRYGQYDYEDEGAIISDIPFYLRTERSADQDHDIDLSQKK